MKMLLAIIGLLPLAALADGQDHYAPLAFLAGSCWKGDLPQQGSLKQSDEHCFSWVYGQRFLRDVHTVRSSDSRPDYVGETTFFWDAAAQQLRYLYIENQGGEGQGAVEAQGDALVFPETDEVEDGKTQAYRSRWQRTGTDAYDVVTEFKINGVWKTAWTVHMLKTQRAPAG